MTGPVRGLGAVTPGDRPTADALFSAIGGVRGIAESVLPGFVFLIVFSITGDLFPSVVAPIGVALLALVVRLVQRLPVMPAIAGGLGIAASAGLALYTGRAADNFIGGFVINGVSLVVFSVSIAVRRPLVGVLARIFAPAIDWSGSARSRRATYIASVMWTVFFALRLAVQVPLYLADATAALAATKLVMGLPLYASMLWVTWMLLRSSHTTSQD